MTHLPEPRRFGGASVTDKLAALARQARDADALSRTGAVLHLRRALETRLEQSAEDGIRQAFLQVDDAAAYRVLHEALARSIDSPFETQASVTARAFAIPLVFVTAAPRPARLRGSLSEVKAIQALFARSQALGPTRNFGLSNALCSLESLERLSPAALWRSARTLDPGAVNARLPPQDIEIAPNQEQTHLRFLVGAAVAAANAPGFTETAANVGGWGRECARLIADQLATSGVQLLVLPRPPQDLISAPHVGRHAQLETALNLFASSNVRRFRSSLGEPSVMVSAHDDGDLRITLSSVFGPELTQGFRWPLHPLDDIEVIEASVLALFADMRVQDVRIVPRVLASERVQGVLLYPRSEEWEALCGGPATH